MNRLAAVQAEPPLRSFATNAPATASSRSASGRTTKGALPPSSMAALTTVREACSRRTRPTSVDPVNDTLRTKGWSSRAELRSLDRVDGTMLTTPSGTPASARIATIASAVSGVSDAGLRMTEHPAASAGPILRVAMAAGKFHGVMRSETPIGWRRTMILFVPAGACSITPPRRTASSAYQRKNSAAYATSLRASASAFPFSRTMSRARASARSVMRSNARRKISLRDRGLISAQVSCAWCATPTAVIASATVPLAISVMTSSVAGSTTGITPSPSSGLPPTTGPSGIGPRTCCNSSKLFMIVLRVSGCVGRDGTQLTRSLSL